MNSLMKYKNYIASINYDDDDKIFWGQILGLKDIIAFHGTSVSELQERFAIHVEEYIEECRRQGIEPQKSYSGNFNIRITEDSHRTAAICATMEQLSLNQYVGQAIAQMNKRTLAKHAYNG